MLLSDITTPCARYVNPEYYKGDPTKWCNWPSIQYPRQANPNKISWALWHRGLNLVFLQDDKKKLHTKLGDWKPAKSYHHQWRWNYTPDGLVKQSPRNNMIKEYYQTDAVHRYFQFRKQGTQIQAVPGDHFPVECSRQVSLATIKYRSTKIFPFPASPLNMNQKQ
jgi:hypothetical protein